MAEEIDEIKNLSPEERIKKLKEIEERNKKEIEKAQKLMKQSEAEIEEEEKSKKQIPIPQLKSVDVTTLFGKGTQEEDMMETKHFKTKKRKEVKEVKEEGIEKAVTPEDKEALEAKVAQERERLREAEEQASLYQTGMNQQQQQYQATLANDLSKGTSGDIYAMVKSAYTEAKETGYVSAGQMEKINAASQAALSKLDAMVSGEYQASKQATDALVASARMAKAMRDNYKA